MSWEVTAAECRHPPDRASGEQELSRERVADMRRTPCLSLWQLQSRGRGGTGRRRPLLPGLAARRLGGPTRAGQNVNYFSRNCAQI